MESISFVDFDNGPEICDMRVSKVYGYRLIGERQFQFAAIQGQEPALHHVF